MKRIMTVLLLALVASGFSIQLQASESDDKARELIKARFQGLKISTIEPSTMPGIYRVTVPPRLFYVSADGKYALDGDVIDLASNENLTKPHRGKALIGAVNDLQDTMITFKPKKTKHTVTVFTDIDCGYCRKLHEAIGEYNKEGIQIRYLAYPRAGLGSGSYKKLVSTWCADDPKAAMTKAKKGEKIPVKDCDNPVARHYKLGQMIGISGTPAMVLENGRVIPGYVPPKQLSGLINERLSMNR